MSVLVTGGTGYIGSHCCVSLLENNYDLIIVDNLSNSNIEVVDKIEKITNKKVKFYCVDITDENKFFEIFEKNNINAVIHLAGLKSIKESMEDPIKYYFCNFVGSLNVIKAIDKYNVKNVIFSSSATIYGEQEKNPIKEDCKKTPVMNVYGKTKLMAENLFIDYYNSKKDLNVTIFRYFNPIGAHESGLIGEDPKGIPNNLLPYISQVAIKKMDCLYVFGNDYNTKDGTCVRDYIHVVDLANGHVQGLKQLYNKKGIYIYNLGTGNGYSVLDVLKTFESVVGHKIPYKIVNRREGDLDEYYADPSKAKKEINFVIKYDLKDMCKSLWNWQIKNKKD